MIDLGITSFPPVLNIIARELGEIRLELNRRWRHDDIKYDRGAMGGKVDSDGVLGELIARHACKRPETTFAPLVALQPQKIPDMVSGSIRADIKAISTQNWNLIVNAEQHLAPKGDITHYLFTKILACDEAHLWLWDYSDISDWPRRVFGFSECYYKPI